MSVTAKHAEALLVASETLVAVTVTLPVAAWSGVFRGGAPLPADSPAGSGPCHTGRADVVLKVRRKIQGLGKECSAAHRV